MRLANEIAAAAMEHVQGVLRPGMTEAQAAAEWLGFVHGEGTGWAGKVELALGFSLVWSGPGIKTFTATATGRWRGRADAVRDLGLRRRILVRPHQEPRARVISTLGLPRARAAADGRLRRRRSTICVPGASLAELDRSVREGIARSAIQASRPTRSATASAHARTSRPTLTRPAAATSAKAWCLQSSQDATGTGAADSGWRTTF